MRAESCTGRIIVTCRDADSRGMSVPAANRRRALLEVWGWPVLLPYSLAIQGDDDEEDR